MPSAASSPPRPPNATSSARSASCWRPPAGPAPPPSTPASRGSPATRNLVANSPLLGIVAQSQCLVEGSAKAEIVPQLTPQDGDVVVTHQRVGGFSASQLDGILRSRGVDTVLFAGVATNASVEGTARQASDLGYRTIIVADACSAADQGSHDASIASLGLLGEITTTAEAVEALSGVTVSA